MGIEQIIERLNKLVSRCDECDFNQCEQCEISWNDVQDIKMLITTLDEIRKEIREHIGFENRLKREKTEPDLFNQGRFYVADNIKNILNEVKGE